MPAVPSRPLVDLLLSISNIEMERGTRRNDSWWVGRIVDGECCGNKGVLPFISDNPNGSQEILGFVSFEILIFLNVKSIF